MKYFIPFIFLLPFAAHAQVPPFGKAIDSTMFTFSPGDPLHHRMPGDTIYHFIPDQDTVDISVDTSGCHVWQVGSTLKPVFSNGVNRISGIMTDTSSTYPKNANDYFILKIGYMVPNVVVDFWHKYQTDSLHAGGIVEFSFDSGATWLNVANCSLVNKQNFYASSDTLLSGQPAFTGHTTVERLSRLQFINCFLPGERVTATSCTFSGYVLTYYSGNDIYLRFRFVSDSATDSLSGWMIDSIKIESPGCVISPGLVHGVTEMHSLDVYPNPAGTEINITSPGKIDLLVISNIIGQPLLTKENCGTDVTADISALPPGIYFIKVNNSDTGKFVKQ